MLACRAMTLMVAMMSFLSCHLAVFPAPVAALRVAALRVAALLVVRWPVGPLLPHPRPHLRTGGVADPLPLFARAVKPLRVRERENERVIVRAWV